MTNILLAVLTVLVLVGFWLTWQRLTRMEALINEVGSMLGEWIDGQSK